MYLLETYCMLYNLFSSHVYKISPINSTCEFLFHFKHLPCGTPIQFGFREPRTSTHSIQFILKLSNYFLISRIVVWMVTGVFAKILVFCFLIHITKDIYSLNFIQKTIRIGKTKIYVVVMRKHFFIMQFVHM